MLTVKDKGARIVSYEVKNEIKDQSEFKYPSNLTI